MFNLNFDSTYKEGANVEHH